MKHNTTLSDQVSGSHLQGDITASYHALVSLFGQPELEGTDYDKVRAEWWIMTPAGIATIYDWKQSQTPLQDVTQWHIGGFSPEVVEHIQRAYFEANIPF
jgi:hypothetical protein